MANGAFKHAVYQALETPRKSSGFARVLGYVLLLLIVLNVVCMFVLTTPDIAGEAAKAIAVFELASGVVFACEYALRVWTADVKWREERLGAPAKRPRLRYMLSPMGIVDLLAFISIFVLYLAPISGEVLNVLRVVRLARLFKITRYMRGVRVILRVLRNQREEIVAATMIILLLATSSSVAMYYLEHAVQPEVFSSAWSGLYWAISSITSTGYGDMVPITAAGRVVGFFTMLLSIAVVAIPGGIFTAGFVAEFQKRKDAGVQEEDAQGGGAWDGDARGRGAWDGDARGE